MVAVSHGYAWECQTQEGGWGLHGIFQEHAWKLRGVVNGIDYQEWNPTVDPHLQSGESLLALPCVPCCGWRWHPEDAAERRDGGASRLLVGRIPPGLCPLEAPA